MINSSEINKNRGERAKAVFNDNSGPVRWLLFGDRDICNANDIIKFFSIAVWLITGFNEKTFGI